MVTLDEMISNYYQKYHGLPNGKPIIRENILNDAFSVVVLETLYKDTNLFQNGVDIQTIARYIVAPPDSGIDIVVEHEDADECFYDFIQVKNSILSEVDIKQCLTYMKRTIDDYLKKPSNVSVNLREILSSTSFDKTYKNNCTYIVVHRGDLNYFKSQKKNEKVITGKELEILKECSSGKILRVPEEVFEADSFNNFIIYDKLNNPDEDAILCNLRGYDLALLSNKYLNTSLGRNVLFGQNLRECLEKSKTYEGMEKTINDSPEKFWFFNNGITVIAEDYTTVNNQEEDNIEKFILKNFSIINGAQTTSALGEFLKCAKLNGDVEAIEKLKKVFVLTRILKVKEPSFRTNIAIFNNTQNPITTRDMASNRDEQNKLHDWLVSGDEPNIYVEIRRGAKKPIDVRFQKHQSITNIELAQLAFAGFYKSPYTAKDKKNTLFDTDYKQEQYVLNEYYHKIFHYSDKADIPSAGILFNKKKEEIDELLFVRYLYKQAKRYLCQQHKERIADARELYEKTKDDEEKNRILESITGYELLTSITNICMFYCVTLYYCYKTEFYKVDEGKYFKYDKFYKDINFREKMIKKFTQIFLSKTIEIIKILSANTGNLNNWVRVQKSETAFLKKTQEDLQINIANKDFYEEFVDMFKE